MQVKPSPLRPLTHRLLPPLLVTAALAGCTSLDVPRADNYPVSSQKKARAIHHWDVLAEDVAQRVTAKIGDWPAGQYPIYIPPAGDADFNQGFRKLLITRLVERGITVSTQPTPIELVVDVQLVQHQAGLWGGNRPAMPATRLSAGVAVARDWYTYTQSAASVVTGVLATSVMLDAVQSAVNGPATGGPTRTEVLITTSLESGQRYLARTADVYYIEADDAPLYTPPTIAVLPPPTPVKTWRVVTP